MATLSPAQLKQQDNRTANGQYDRAHLSPGMADTTSFPTPDDHEPALIELPTDPNSYRLPPDAIEWDNLPEAQLAIEENSYDIAATENDEAAREYLRTQWRRHHQRFTDARTSGDIVTAAVHAEHLRHIEKIATRYTQ